MSWDTLAQPAVPQQVWPVAHWAAAPQRQLPPLHESARVASQRVPHAPQLFLSSARVAQAAVVPVPQQVSFPAHRPPLPHLHDPSQWYPPAGHFTPQPPQLSTLVVVLTHDALVPLVQQVFPVVHASDAPHLQRPATQLLADVASQVVQVPPQRAVSVDGMLATQGPAAPFVQVLLPKPQAAPPVSGPTQSTCVPSTQAPTTTEYILDAIESVRVALRESCTATVKLVDASTWEGVPLNLPVSSIDSHASAAGSEGSEKV